jgi:NADH-quinone oxidoreductase subunit L
VVALALGSPIAETHLFGVPGSWVLWFIYALALAAAFMTAIYMTRLMIYTFHGPSRVGTAEEGHVHEAPWVMTLPLIVLGLLSAFGGWLNLPALFPLGRIHVLDGWLEPVVGAARDRLSGAEAHLSHGAELALVGVAVAVAVAGMLVAKLFLKPAALVPKAQAARSRGFGGVLERAYSVDQGVDRVLVRPTVTFSRKLLWRGLDNGLIDGLLVNGSAVVARGFAWAGSRVQSGNLGSYAWIFVVGALVVLGALTFR